MPAKQSFIFLCEPGRMPPLDVLLSHLDGEALGPLLPLRSALLLDHESGTEHQWEFTEGEIDVPELGPTEFLFLYGAGNRGWNLCLSNTGLYQEFQIATPIVSHPEWELRKLWERLGALFLAAFTGEELELYDLDLESLQDPMMEPRISSSCEIAVLPERWFASRPDEAVPLRHHAFLFRSE